MKLSQLNLLKFYFFSSDHFSMLVNYFKFVQTIKQAEDMDP